MKGFGGVIDMRSLLQVDLEKFYFNEAYGVRRQTETPLRTFGTSTPKSGSSSRPESPRSAE